MSLTQISKELEEKSQISQKQIEQLMLTEKQSQIEELTSLMQEQDSQIEEYKTLLAKKEEELTQEKVKNKQIQGTMEDTQDNLNKYKAAYNDLLNNPKIKVEREIEYKNVPTIDNRVFYSYGISALLIFIFAGVKMLLSDNKEIIIDSFFYDMKLVFTYIRSSVFIFVACIIGVILFMTFCFFSFMNYEKADKIVIQVSLVNLTSVIILAEEYLLKLCIKINQILKYDFLIIHPFYIWLLVMIIAYVTYYIVRTVKR